METWPNKLLLLFLFYHMYVISIGTPPPPQWYLHKWLSCQSCTLSFFFCSNLFVQSCLPFYYQISTFQAFSSEFSQKGVNQVGMFWFCCSSQLDSDFFLCILTVLVSVEADSHCWCFFLTVGQGQFHAPLEQLSIWNENLQW